MLDKLITSKSRIKVLLKLFLNPGVSAYLRELATEFQLSPTALKEELDELSAVGYLDKTKKGRSIYFKANTSHPFFKEIHSIVRKHVGIDELIAQILSHLGKVEAVYVLEDYARGVDSGLIDVLIVGDVDHSRLQHLTAAAEKRLSRKVRVMVQSQEEFIISQELFFKRAHWKIV